MSLIEEALRQIEAGQAKSPKAAPAPATPASTHAPSPVSEQSPATAPDTVRSGRRRRAVETRSSSLSPWIGFLAAAGGSSLLLIIGLLLGSLWASRGPSPALIAKSPALSPQEPAPVLPVATAPVPAEPNMPTAPVRRHRVRGPSAKAPVLRLNGIVEGEGEPLVIVNGQILRLGETIDGAVLVDIEEDAARFEWKDQEVLVRTTP
jgi:hypothetical protein